MYSRVAGVYGLVLDYLASALPRMHGTDVYIDRENRIVVVDDGDHLVVIQVHDQRLFDSLVSAGGKDRSFYLVLVDEVETSSVVPDDLSFVRASKSDVAKIVAVKGK